MIPSTARTRVLQGKMVRPERFELPAFWFVAARPTLPNLARGVANRANSASWDNFSQTAFSFFCRHLLHNRSCFPRFALPFRDRTTSRFRSSRRQFIFPGSLGWLRGVASEGLDGCSLTINTSSRQGKQGYGNTRGPSLDMKLPLNLAPHKYVPLRD